MSDQIETLRLWVTAEIRNALSSSGDTTTTDPRLIAAQEATAKATWGLLKRELTELLTVPSITSEGGLFLNHDELSRLTGHKQIGRQVRALQRMHIYFEENPIGEILVSRSYIEKRFSGQSNNPAVFEGTPNYEAIKNLGKRGTKSGK